MKKRKKKKEKFFFFLLTFYPFWDDSNKNEKIQNIALLLKLKTKSIH